MKDWNLFSKNIDFFFFFFGHSGQTISFNSTSIHIHTHERFKFQKELLISWFLRLNFPVISRMRELIPEYANVTRLEVLVH